MLGKQYHRQVEAKNQRDDSVYTESGDIVVGIPDSEYCTSL